MKTFWLVLTFLIMSSSADAFTLVSTNPGQRGWNTRDLIFKLNPTNCPANIFDLINETVALWNSIPTSGLIVRIDGSSSTTAAQLIGQSAVDSPVVVCESDFSNITGTDGNGVAGVGGAYTLGSNYLAYGYLIINVEPGKSANINNLGKQRAIIVLAHEVGHALGIGHSEDGAALMYYNISAKTDAHLAQDDIDAMTYLYPRNELGHDRLFGCGYVAGKVFGSGSGGSGGSGTGTAAGLLLLTPLGLLFLLRKSRTLLT
jgi:hypothetical protein